MVIKELSSTGSGPLAPETSVKVPSMRRLFPAALALVIIAVGLGVGRVLSAVVDARRAQNVLEQGEHRAKDARLRAADALEGQISRTELTAQNAATNPRLVAAMEGGVDNDTLRDIFLTESWWARYRDTFDSYGVAKGETIATIKGSPLATPDSAALVRAARDSNRAVSALVPTSEGVYIAAAVVIPLVSRVSPVLVVATQLDQAMADTLAARAGGPVAISDGRRMLAVAGESPQGKLAAAVGGAKGGSLRDGGLLHLGPTGAAAVKMIAPSLWLLTYVDVKDFAEHAVRADKRLKQAIWVLDGALMVIVMALLWRRARARRFHSALSALAQESFLHARPQALLAGGPGAAAENVGSGTVLRHGANANDISTREGNANAQKLGRYLLLEQIGEGGMAQIFTAIRIATGGFRRAVVIKRLRPDLATNAEAVSQFIDEANLASQLVHSNIVPVFDFGKASGHYYIAQEYIVGRDLGRVLTRLQQQGTQGLPLRSVLFAGREVLHALDYAHNKRAPDGKPAGIVHRDITPENVMLSARGEVKLLDFGIVKATEGRVTKTQLGMVKGSIGFMSPEQTRGRDVDNRSDLFSVGLLMFTLYKGHSLYQGGTTYDLMVKAATGPSVPELEQIAQLPAPLPQIILQALAVNPAERFQSAAEFAAALDPHIGNGGDELVRLVDDQFSVELQAEERRSAVTNGPFLVLDPEPTTEVPAIANPRHGA